MLTKYLYNINTKVRPNQIWQGHDDAHSLIIIARSMVLPYLIGSYFKFNSNTILAVRKAGHLNMKTTLRHAF